MNVLFWYDLADDYSLEVLEHLVPFLPNITSFTNFAVAFKVYGSDILDSLDRAELARFCFGDGEYCLRSNNLTSSLENARNLMFHGLKIDSMFGLVGDSLEKAKALVEYIQRYRQVCVQELDRDLCDGISDLKFIETLESSPDKKRLYAKAMIDIEKIGMNPEQLHGALDTVKLSNAMFGSYDATPALFIEGTIVRGTLTSQTAVSAVCDCLRETPEVCSDVASLLAQNFFVSSEAAKELAEARPAVYDNYLPPSDPRAVPFYLGFLVLVATVFVLLLIFHFGKKLLTRLIETDFKTQVEGSTQQYIQMKALEKSGLETTKSYNDQL